MHIKGQLCSYAARTLRRRKRGEREGEPLVVCTLSKFNYPWIFLSFLLLFAFSVSLCIIRDAYRYCPSIHSSICLIHFQSDPILRLLTNPSACLSHFRKRFISFNRSSFRHAIFVFNIFHHHLMKYVRVDGRRIGRARARTEDVCVDVCRVDKHIKNSMRNTRMPHEVIRDDNKR